MGGDRMIFIFTGVCDVEVSFTPVRLLGRTSERGCPCRHTILAYYRGVRFSWTTYRRGGAWL